MLQTDHSDNPDMKDSPGLIPYHPPRPGGDGSIPDEAVKTMPEAGMMMSYRFDN